MRKKNISEALFSLSLAALLFPALVACGTVDTEEPPDAQTIYDAPPVARAPIEDFPVIHDLTTEIWCPGYWAPAGRGTFTWVPGKILTRPSPTASWQAARWVHHMYGWTFQQGHWQ